MPCTDKNPLTREGASLLNRVLAALSAGYAKADERSAADLILFAKRYGAYLNYYDEDNNQTGDWGVMMSSDVSVGLATLSRLNLQEISDYKKRIYKRIIQATSDADAKEQFKFLFDLLFSLVTIIDRQYQLLPADFEYRSIFSEVIKNKLQLPLANIEKCFNDFKALSLLDYSTIQLDNDALIEIITDKDFSRSKLISPEWQTAVADLSLTLPASSAKDTIVYVINHNLFNTQAELILKGISAAVKRANDLFTQTLDSYPGHSPHFALFLAFIKLFSNAQNSLNTYTERHLDFYFKDTLQLKNKLPEADSAHLVFELQKPVNEDRIIKDTLFKGGKDSTGKEINYAITQDIILNKATVGQLQSQQIIKTDTGVLIASAVANSDDGQGADLASADKSWFTFGDVKKAKKATAGFAIASNVLYLNEGTRTITLTVSFANTVPELATFSQYNAACFSAYFTGKKKWETVNGPITATTNGISNLTFIINLSPDDAAFTAYDEKVHAAGMGITLPALKILLDQSIGKSIPYTLLCDKEISFVEVTVSVSNVKDLVLSNDSGAIDTSKPFKPFGDFPKLSSGFYIGSKEVFQKPLTQLTLNTNWAASANPTLNAKAQYLRQNAFGTDAFDVSTGSTMYRQINFSGGNPPFIPTAIDFSSNQKLTATTREGFLRLQLDDSSFSLQQYLTNVNSSINGTTIKPGSGTPPPYTINTAALPVPPELLMDSFSIDYKASAIITFDVAAPIDNNLFFNIGEFGFKRINQSLINATAAGIRKPTLLQDIENAGELFIGLQSAAPKMVVNILFQVSDGSSNPLRDMETVAWYYLAANNNWKQFTAENLVDNTNNLTQSGILTFTLPADITDTNTEHQPGLWWLKAGVKQYTDAVCKLIAVQAQAARVQLVQDSDKGIEFRQPLAASSISKLLASDSSIKSISQPFDSFDGRIRESDDQFYIRVSERLRHKQRAITMWDYEHIILEKFQKIFKVKCINHAGFYMDGGAEVFCENYAGHVSVITIPNLNNNTNYNPLRPYTPIGLLTNINDYLKTITSPFVKLHVKNPQFEEIQLDFKVQFCLGYQEDYYIALLQTEIEQFMCPWAFGGKTEISFGGVIYKSALINFIEERPYVDFVTCFKMNHIINRGQPGAKTIADIDEAAASSARSILVSYFDEDNNVKHKIVSPETCTC